MRRPLPRWRSPRSPSTRRAAAVAAAWAFCCCCWQRCCPLASTSADERIPASAGIFPSGTQRQREAVHRQGFLHEVQFLVAPETQAVIHLPRGLHGGGGVQDHLAMTGLAGKLDAEFGERLADAMAAPFGIDGQQADARSVAAGTCRSARTVMRHVA